MCSLNTKLSCGCRLGQRLTFTRMKVLAFSTYSGNKFSVLIQIVSICLLFITCIDRSKFILRLYIGFKKMELRMGLNKSMIAQIHRSHFLAIMEIQNHELLFYIYKILFRQPTSITYPKFLLMA